MSNPVVVFKSTNSQYFNHDQLMANATFYNLVAEEYADNRAWVDGNTSAIKDNLIAKVSKIIAKGNKIVVVGTGTGRDQYLLQEAGFVCTGVDPSKKMIAQAKKRFSDHFVVSHAHDMPFPDGEFDFLYCEAAGEHFDLKYVHLALQEFKRVIKRNCDKPQILFSFRSGNDDIIEVNDMGLKKYFFTMKPETLTKITDDIGLRVVESWKAVGGTPSIKEDFPWINNLLEVVK